MLGPVVFIDLTVTGNDIYLSWEPLAEAEGGPVLFYNIYLATNEEGPWGEPIQVPAAVESLTFNEMTPGEYHFQVVGEDANGSGLPSLVGPALVDTDAEPEPEPEPTDYDLFLIHYPTSPAPQETVEALWPHATELVEAHILAAYDPTDADTVAVMTRAVAHQVAAWLETGDSNDLAGYAPTVVIKVDGLEVGGQPATISPRTVRTLRAAGLTRPVGA